MPQPALGDLQLAFRDLRSLLPVLDPGQLAVAGHAVALSQWHQVGWAVGGRLRWACGGGGRACSKHAECRCRSRLGSEPECSIAAMLASQYAKMLVLSSSLTACRHQALAAVGPLPGASQYAWVFGKDT